MYDLVCAAQELGFKARGAVGSYSDLLQEAMPCIAHISMPDGLQHFVVIFKMSDTHLLLGDPARGLG